MRDARAESIQSTAAKRSRRSTLLAAVFAVLVIALLPPANVSAAARLTINVRIGSDCIVGGLGAVGTVRLAWKAADGSLKARVDVPLNSSDYWVYCSSAWTVESGDTIRIDDGAGARTVVVPVVTLILDRATDTFSGRGPAGADGFVYWHAGLYEDYFDGASVTPDIEGDWSLTPSAFDLIGGISSWVEWTTENGDRFTNYPKLAPYVQITLNRSQFSGGGADPHAVITVKLRDPQTSTLVGVGMATANGDGYFAGKFFDGQGEPVAVSAGLRVKSRLAADLDWIVPAIDGSADVANDLVFGRCEDTGTAYGLAPVSVYRDGQRRGFALAQPDSTGEFAVDFGQTGFPPYDAVDVRHGDRVRIECIQVTGDIAQTTFRVP